MALKFDEGTFEQIAQREEVQTELEPILANLHMEVNVPKIANREDLTKFFGRAQPLQVVLQNGMWKYVTAEKDYDAMPFLKGNRFEETPCGIYELRLGERRSKITNATVRIDSIREVYVDDENKNRDADDNLLNFVGFIYAESLAKALLKR